MAVHRAKGQHHAKGKKMSESEKKLSKAETEHKEAIKAVYDMATEHDIETAKDICMLEEAKVVDISPAVASVIVFESNKRNRGLTISKVVDYKNAISRGEWKLNHQGLAFYPDHTLADGQHRLNALALSSKTVKFLVFPNFDKNAIDTIDRSKGRTAGEALEMIGIAFGKEKASIGKTCMEYEYELAHGARPRFSDQQVEKWVMENDHTLDKAVDIGDMSLKNVSDPAMNKAEAKTIALLMLRGGWNESIVSGFVASIQQGIGTYAESPTVALSRLFLKSKLSNKRTDTLTKKQKLALAMKGANLWAEEKSVARLMWKANKEDLTSNQPNKQEAA